MVLARSRALKNDGLPQDSGSRLSVCPYHLATLVTMAPRVTRPPKTGKHTAHYADFVTRFTERENDKRKVKKPETLTVKQRAALRRQLKDVKFLKPDYCDATKINIAGILRKWKAYDLPGLSMHSTLTRY